MAIENPVEKREQMVRRQIQARGIQTKAVLQAMQTVPRHEFLPETLQEFAYTDHALPIEEDQTISQPFIVALMTEALQLDANSRVLEIGTGSGYAAAILARIASEVYTIERHPKLARQAREVIDHLGYDNIHIRQGDGTQGWPEAQPFDAISVTAGGPEVPESLKQQLAVGGRLVLPVGPSLSLQTLLRITRVSQDEFHSEELSQVRFVPLIGEEGWDDPVASAFQTGRSQSTASLIREHSIEFSDVESLDVTRLAEEISDAQIVLLGEATHGTSEFYRIRAHLSRELIAHHGFNTVAVEADWPDARRIDDYVRHYDRATDWTAFARFPTWMWRNEEVLEFVEWLREYNQTLSAEERAGFYGLDLYSMYRSIDEVLKYLEEADPQTAQVAKTRYGCLTPYEGDPAIYGRAAITGQYRSCEKEALEMLRGLLEKEIEYREQDGERFFDAVQNARLVSNSEKYYRYMYYGSEESWNLRDQHMFETLQSLMKRGREPSRAIVWEHNSHIGDARATEMSARGELNVGQLCRQEFGAKAILVGFGTYQGEVAAASNWGGEVEFKTIQPALSESYEHLFHETGLSNGHLNLTASGELRQRLLENRLERAIGVIYRPQTERSSHYFHATLPRQFDYYFWVDQSAPVRPLSSERLKAMPDTFPFGV